MFVQAQELKNKASDALKTEEEKAEEERRLRESEKRGPFGLFGRKKKNHLKL